MRSRLLVIGLLAVVLGFNASVCAAVQQPEIEARVAPIIEFNGLQFRDLNKNGALDAYEDWRLPMEQRVDNLLSLMTLEEKAGLMSQPEPWFGFMPRGYTEEEAKYWILDMDCTMAIINDSLPPAEFAEFTNGVQEVAESGRLGIPFLYCTDNTTGRGTGFNYLAAAAAGDPELVRAIADASREEMRAVGLHMTLQPQVDLATEPRWNRVSGTFGEDAYLAASLAREFVLGFQQEELDSDSVATCAKHFPGSGPEQDGYDAHNKAGDTLVYPGGNFNYHLIPFKAVIDAGTATIMPYYAIPSYIDTVGAHFSETTMDILRNQLGYDGIIQSDWHYLYRRPWGIYEGTPVEEMTVKERVELVLNSRGSDNFGGMCFRDTIVELVEEGRVPEEYIDESCRKILTLRYTLGLFEDPYVDPAEAEAIVGTPEHLALEAELAERSVTMLKNDGILPLRKGTKVFVSEISPEAIAPYATVTADLAQADVAVVKVSFRVNQEDLTIPDANVETIKSLTEAGIPTVVVFSMRNPAVIQEVADIAPAILWQFVGDSVGDSGVAKVLFGDLNPSAKMPFEIASSMDAVTNQYEDVPHDTGSPTFPAGYGLSYGEAAEITYADIAVTRFEVLEHEDYRGPADIVYQDVTGSPEPIPAGEPVLVSAKVRNAGADGGTMVTLYVDGKAVDSRFVGFNDREVRNVEFTVDLGSPGRHVVGVGTVSVPVVVN